ncbi:hypothetical protein DFJ77DRAFT_217662 [Powellomyces hirtus]|nr:hypothetical protein DFJ77DRAFT_217662 [Powellomyces hirtus]
MIEFELVQRNMAKEGGCAGPDVPIGKEHRSVDLLLSEVNDICHHMEQIMTDQESKLREKKTALIVLRKSVAALIARVTRRKGSHKSETGPDHRHGTMPIMGFEFPLPERSSPSPTSTGSPILSPLTRIPPIPPRNTSLPSSQPHRKLACITTPSLLFPPMHPHLRGRSPVQSQPPPLSSDFRAYAPGTYMWSPTAATLATASALASPYSAVDYTEEHSRLIPHAPPLSPARSFPGMTGRRQKAGRMWQRAVLRHKQRNGTDVERSVLLQKNSEATLSETWNRIHVQWRRLWKRPSRSS